MAQQKSAKKVAIKRRKDKKNIEKGAAHICYYFFLFATVLTGPLRVLALVLVR